MAALSVENHEKTLYTAFKNFPELNFGRQVDYGYARRAETKTPYILIYPITWVPIGMPQADYLDQMLPDLDMIEQLNIPSEISFSVVFGGGNARGQLGLCLVNLHKNSDIIDHLLVNGMALQRDSGGADNTGQIGAQNEQRAQTDLFFLVSIAPEERIIPSIQEVKGAGGIFDPEGGKIEVKIEAKIDE